ncbi:MAG: alpha/beta hydrolase [Acidobacteriia bacterium]|nr:alpha/beta hydrolase [Terriglobia bacterium]
MAKKSDIHSADLLGFSRLAVDATAGITALAEALHHNIALAPGIFDTPAQGPAGGIAGLVYESIRSVTGLVSGGIEATLAPLVPMLKEKRSPPERQAVLAALNGVMGDYLAATDNPLAISMRLRRAGKPLTLEREALAGSIPRFNGKLAVLAHGLCMNDLQWTRKRHNHGAALARDLGYTPVHLHYNSGLHISTNGQSFATLLEALLEQWPAPLEEFVIVAHSMGGLVSRSAYHYATVAQHKWPARLRKIVFLGTPHHGTPLEVVANWVNGALDLSPYTAAFTRLANVRSAGITDLRYGNLLDDDWHGRDRFEHAGDLRRPMPLPEGVPCYAIAATGEKTGDRDDELLGDGIVPVNSALGRHSDPAMTLSFGESRQWIGHNMNHFELLSKPAVYEQIKRWLEV